MPIGSVDAPSRRMLCPRQAWCPIGSSGPPTLIPCWVMRNPCQTMWSPVTSCEALPDNAMPYFRRWCSTGICDASSNLMHCRGIRRQTGQCDALAENAMPHQQGWASGECSSRYPPVHYDARLEDVMSYSKIWCPTGEDYAPLANRCSTKGGNALSVEVPNRIIR